MGSEPKPQPGRVRPLIHRLTPADDILALLGALAPPVLAALAFLGGLTLLLTGTLGTSEDSRSVLRDLLPLPFVEASHLAASLSGLALLLLSRGLARRMARARAVATAFLLAGALFALLRGLDWEEALALLLIAALLQFFRAEFDRAGGWGEVRPGPTLILVMALAIAGAVTTGMIVHRNTGYSTDLWWRFAWQGDAPRFLRAMLAVSVALAVLAVDRLLNHPAPVAAPPATIPAPVARLVDASPDAARRLALLGDKRFLLSPEEDAFLMYGIEGRSWISLAGPVGAPDAGRALIVAFAAAAHRAGASAVFSSLPPALLEPVLDLGHVIVKMGEMAHVDLTRFSLDGSARKDLRYARSRAIRDGLSFAILPAAEVPVHMPRLRAISDRWLATKKGGEKGFALGYFDPGYLARFDLAVMRAEGDIVAFANLWRGAGRAEMACDLMRHLPGQSGALMEAFFTEMILHAQAEGYRRFLLGGAPMSGMPDHPLAPLWARIGAVIYRHGDEFYNFEGLRAFKEKFGPDWSPLYLTCPSALGLPRAFFDLARLVSRGPAPVPANSA